MYDYNDLFDQHDLEQRRRESRLPKCSYCGEHIQDEYCYFIRGDLICDRCLEDNHRIAVDDYI